MILLFFINQKQRRQRKKKNKERHKNNKPIKKNKKGKITREREREGEKKIEQVGGQKGSGEAKGDTRKQTKIPFFWGGGRETVSSMRIKKEREKTNKKKQLRRGLGPSGVAPHLTLKRNKKTKKWSV